MFHLYLCGFERGEDALEEHTQWVRNKTTLSAPDHAFLKVEVQMSP